MRWSKIRRPKGFRRGELRSLLEQRIVKKAKKDRPKNVTLEIEADNVKYIVQKNYIPDVCIRLPSGKTRYIEIKGWLRPEDRSKTLAVIRDNPSIDLRFVFAKDNRLNKNTETRYSTWCNKHGIKYSFESIPKEWFVE